MSGRKSEQSRDSQQRLLEAGQRLVERLAPEDLLPGIRAVCREADLPTGSLYHSFGGATEYYAALVRFLISRDSTAEVSDSMAAAAEAMREWIADEGPDGRAVEREVIGIATQNISGLIDQARSAARTEHLLVAVCDQDTPVADTIRDSYRTLYRGLAGNQEAAVNALTSALGCRVRPPFTPASVAQITCALADGLALRSHFDPTLDATTVFEDAMRVLVIALLSHEDDPFDVDELVALTIEQASRPEFQPITEPA